MSGGTYVLVVDLGSRAEIEFGAAGERILASGWYAYVGSALGPGGFSRIDRHRHIAAGESATRHWHIDYLLGTEAARISEVVRLSSKQCECDLAEAMTGEPVQGIGASDCRCPSHLHRISRPAAVQRAVRTIA